MSIKNKVQLIGNNEFYIDKEGNKQTDTQWHNLVAWNKTAELIEKYVSKGKQIGVEGKLTSGSFDDKEGGKRYFTEVRINELLLLADPRNENS